MKTKIGFFLGLTLAIVLAALLVVSDNGTQKSEPVMPMPNTEDIEKHSSANVEANKPRVIVQQNQSHLTSVNFNVTFPDGSSIETAFRSVDPVNVERIGNVAAVFSSLEERAINGDGDAAMSLSVALEECTHLGYQTEAEVNSVIDLAVSEGRITTAFGGKDIQVGFMNMEQARDFRKMLTSASVRCRGLSVDQVSKQKKFLDLAFEHNSPLAVNQVATRSPPGEEKFNAYLKAWHLGDYSAPAWLARGHSEGWVDGKKDPVMAFAYNLLGHELTRIAFTDENGNVDRMFYRVSPDSIIQEKAAELDHAQYTEAVELAKKLLESNQKCCQGLYTASDF